MEGPQMLSGADIKSPHVARSAEGGSLLHAASRHENVAQNQHG